MLVAAAISVIGTGTLFADYYQQGSGYYYPSNNESNYRTQDFDQPPHHFNPANYGTQPSNYQAHPQNYSAQPSPSQGYVVQQTYPSQQQSDYSQSQAHSQQQSYYSQQPQGGTTSQQDKARYTNQQGSQSYLQKNAQSNQEIVRSNDKDKFTTDEDRRLGFQIRQQIAEKFPQIDLNAIAIYIDEGSVRLSGKVRDEKLRTDLSNLIKELKGVKSVTNKLEVPGQKGQNRDSLAVNETNKKYPSYVNPQQKNTYPNSTSNWENTPAPSSNITGQDSLLADKIRQAIASDHSLSPQAKSIGVLVSSKSITLNGTVKSEVEKSRIAAKVRGLGEGRTINNMLEVNKTR